MMEGGANLYDAFLTLGELGRSDVRKAALSLSITSLDILHSLVQMQRIAEEIGVGIATEAIEVLTVEIKQALANQR